MHGEGAGRGPRLILKLNNNNNLEKPHGAGPSGRRENGRPTTSSVRPDRIWPATTSGVRVPGAIKLLFIMIATICGCGGATVPCPTPVADLDRHRTESEEAQAAAEGALERAREAEAEKVEAERRVVAARAEIDSLAALGAKREATRKPSPKR